jgi:putative ABC transport system permease protein
MKDGGRGAAGDRSGLTLRRGLVVATVALALTLLVGAGLLVRSFARLMRVDPGFKPERVLTFNVALPQATYANDTLRLAFFERATAAVAAVPGVKAVGGTSVLPFGGGWSTASFNVEGYQAPANTPGPWGDIRRVTPGFFPALEIPVRAGRALTAEDRAEGRQVVVVDEELVARYWPGEDPIGKRITFNDPGDSAIAWIEVVGVVGHTMHEGLDGGRRVQLYFPVQQSPVRFLVFAVRTEGDPLAALPAVKAAIRTVDPNLPLSNPNSLESLIEGSTGPRRFSMVLLALFSGLAALLAAIGLYGVMAYTVTQRSRELGVRLALGASARDLLGLVVGQGMRLVLLGVGIGLVAALALSRLLTTMLFGVGSTDLLTYVGITLLLLTVTAIATWLPARRATRVDPAVVLREE